MKKIIIVSPVTKIDEDAAKTGRATKTSFFEALKVMYHHSAANFSIRIAEENCKVMYKKSGQIRMLSAKSDGFEEEVS